MAGGGLVQGLNFESFVVKAFVTFVHKLHHIIAGGQIYGLLIFRQFLVCAGSIKYISLIIHAPRTTTMTTARGQDQITLNPLNVRKLMTTATAS